MKRFLWLLAVPVFFPFGPNLVRYSQIVETSLNDMNIKNMAKMACEIQLDNGDLLMIEGKLLQTDPQLLIYYNSVIGAPLPFRLDDKHVLFCLTSESQMY